MRRPLPVLLVVAVAPVWAGACASPVTLASPPRPAHAPSVAAPRAPARPVAAGVDFARPERATALADASPEGEADGAAWRHTVSLYGWVPNLKGDVELRGRQLEPSISRSDILDNTDIAFTGRYEVQPPGSTWSFWGDVFWAKLEDDQSASTPFGGLKADFEARLTIVEVAAAKHLWQSEEEISFGSRTTTRTKLDVYAGARYWRLKTEAQASLTDAGLKAGIDKTEDWIDPIVGARIRHGLAPRWWLVAKGDIGGFGAGADFAWTARATVQYALSEQWAVGAGWQHADFDYDPSDFEADLSMSGPIIFVTYDF